VAGGQAEVPALPPRPAAELLGNLRREVERSLLRGRNGIRLLTGGAAVQVGQTPKETIWRRDKVEVWHYANPRITQELPLLLVMSLVTRTYIFDLLPGDSIVERLLAAGFDVYLVDWGIPEAAESQNTLTTYVDGYLPLCIAAACRESGQPAVGVLGYCLGGDIALLSLAGNPDLPVHCLALMATPIDFGAMGLPVSLIREGRIEPGSLIDASGNVPPGVLLNSFRLRNPTGEIVQYANLLDRLWSDEFVRSYQALNRWIHEHIPFPGALAREMVEICVRRNQLARGSVLVGGRRIRLRSVTCPVLNIIAERDDIVPVAAAAPLRKVIGSRDYEEFRVDAGHVALVTGRLGHTRTIPAIIDWFLRHPLQAAEAAG
jgi:polyhydroxyalkanoate synthase subunit PhaC